MLSNNVKVDVSLLPAYHNLTPQQVIPITEAVCYIGYKEAIDTYILCQRPHQRDFILFAHLQKQTPCDTRQYFSSPRRA